MLNNSSMALLANTSSQTPKDSEDRDPKKTVNFSPKQIAVVNRKGPGGYPPIRFNSKCNMWDGIAQKVLVGKESSAFKDELLENHELFRGTLMQQKRHYGSAGTKKETKLPWAWIVEQYEKEQEEKKLAERRAWAQNSPAKSNASGSPIGRGISQFDSQVAKAQECLHVPSLNDGSIDSVGFR